MLVGILSALGALSLMAPNDSQKGGANMSEPFLSDGFFDETPREREDFLFATIDTPDPETSDLLSGMNLQPNHHQVPFAHLYSTKTSHPSFERPKNEQNFPKSKPEASL